MKYFLAFFQILLFNVLAFGQVITVTVSDAYEFEYRPDSYSVTISESILSLSKQNFVSGENKTPSERKIEFETSVEGVFEYLKENNISYTEIEVNNDEPMVHAGLGSIVLNTRALELSTSRQEFDKFESYVLLHLGLGFTNQDSSIIDDAFMKECLDKLTIKAEELANEFALPMNRELAELKEMKIIKYIVSEMASGWQASLKENKSTTHTASFVIEFSFDTK